MLGGVAAAAVICAALWWGLRDRPSPSTPPPSAQPSHPAAAPRSLLLVTIDTLRADRIGAYGDPSASTPALDRLARDGVRFSRAYAAAPITLPSHATLFSGRYPPGHGSRHNGMRARDEAPMLAERLGARGLAAAAFVSAFPLDARFGLSRGFTLYDDELPRRADGRPADERPGARTVDAALGWLEGHRDAPFFLWVHLFEPHAPYEARPGVGADAPVEARYAAEVAEADRQVARLLDGLGTARADTLIVVTSDHGEAFGEHGEIAHSVFVYDTTLQVPLVLQGPGIAAGHAVDEPVGLVDLAPTLLSLLAPGESMDTDGVDLAPLVRAPGADRAADTRAPRWLYAESYAPLLDFGWSPLRAVRHDGWKLIDAPRPEVFHVAADPLEMEDRAAADAARRTTLLDGLRRFGPAEPIAAPTSSPPDGEAASRLAALGYVTPGRVGITRADPKDRREIAARIAAIVSGEVPPARQRSEWEAVLRLDAANAQAHLRLGVLLVEAGDCAAAAPHLKQAISARMPSADPYLSLAFCAAGRGDRATAANLLRSARSVEPGHPVVEANLGLLAFEDGRLDEAIDALERALASDPDLHAARFTLARALGRQGRRAEASHHAADLLRRLPADAPQRAEVQRLLEALR